MVYRGDLWCLRGLIDAYDSLDFEHGQKKALFFSGKKLGHTEKDRDIIYGNHAI